MTPPFLPAPKAGQPSLNELMSRFLVVKGTSPGDVSAEGSQVEPHEVVGGFRTPAKTTWDEAMAVFRLAGMEPEFVTCPPEWAAFTALGVQPTLIPLAAGFFPQAARDVSRLGRLDMAREAQPVAGFTALRGWVRKAMRSQSPTALLLAAGVAACLGDTDEASAALAAAEPLCDGPWRKLWEVQKSAVFAVQGRFTDDDFPLTGTGDNSVLTYNRGLLNLAQGNRPAGIRLLERASVALPDGSGWRHLAMLYAASSKS